MEMQKNKLEIAGIGNWDNENFIKIKVNKNNEIHNIISSFMKDIGIDSYLEEIEGERKNYKDSLGGHNFFENTLYKVHVIFEKNYLYLIIKTPLKNRKNMIEKLMHYAQWVKNKKK